MKKYTFPHFMRVYALVTCLALIPVLVDRLPNVDFGTQLSMILVWVITLVTFVLMHRIIKLR
jgi:hypothetical protein